MERYWLLFGGFVCYLTLQAVIFWKLKLGHLSLELRFGFSAERVTKVCIKSLEGDGLPFPSHP